MTALTDERGATYGHPSAHFARTVGILRIVFGDTPMSALAPEDWAVVMQCDKLARFAETRSHEDSQRDIAGYSETWFMCRDRSLPTLADALRVEYGTQR